MVEPLVTPTDLKIFSTAEVVLEGRYCLCEIHAIDDDAGVPPMAYDMKGPGRVTLDLRWPLCWCHRAATQKNYEHKQVANSHILRCPVTIGDVGRYGSVDRPCDPTLS